MTMENFDNSFGELKKSGYNEAQLKITRIHELQRIIDLVSIDPLGFYNDSFFKIGITFGNKRNYEVAYQCDISLLRECYPKCNDKEKKELLNLKNEIDDLLSKTNPHDLIHSDLRNEWKSVINPSNWNKIKEKLLKFDLDIRSSLDKHGYGTKDSQDPAYAAYS